MPVMGSFGPIVFEALKAPETVTGEAEETFAEHEIAGAKGLLEWTGEKLSRLTLKLKLQAVSVGTYVCDPSRELKRLEDLFREHEAHPLFIGPRFLGKFVIEKIKETLRELDARGNLIAAEVELTLKEYH